MEKFASGQPYTEAERERDRQTRKEIDERQFKRRKFLRQRYASRGTPATRRVTNRMLGERD